MPIVFIIWFTTLAVLAKEYDRLKIPKSLQEAIPVGYKVVEKIVGDLNKDKQHDIVLLLKGLDKSKIITNRFSEVVDRNRRGVLIAFKDHDAYKVVTVNPRCFSSENEDGGIYFPPDLFIHIAKGNLYFDYGHGRYGYWSYTFRYEDNDFKLIGYDAARGGAVIRETLSVNFLTNKMLTKKNINLQAQGGDEVFKEEWKSFSKPITLFLSEIADMDEIDIEQAINEQISYE
ncbi:MAG TPA: hypothetical protein ENK98_01230 [Epsilonproteobacteria bacterium]|nr:hypothetical protein [Campylobacterota bacterium]